MALSTHRASTSRTSAEWAPPRWKHDVFLSFRGEDTRRGFVSHLDRALAFWQAMRTFKDDRELEVGATISLELLTAIEESYLAIIVLSPNYASSTWCLDELSKILECMEDTKRILPIFCDVDPSNVRHQRGSFAEAFTKHEERFSGDAEKLNRWRAALTKVANLTGLDSKNYKSEAELVDDIVKRVWKKVNPTFTLLDSQEKLVGIDSALDQLRLHLAPEENDVHFIGIWGMGGVGKTALANLVFQKISRNFELKCFLSNVRTREVCDLQGQLLSPLLNGNHIWDEMEGTDFIQNRLCNKKVLLVLDDVDHLNQLEKLVGNEKWFGMGSRIIITTRDERLLDQHDIKIRYKVEVLKDDEALELFSQNAFKKNQPEEGFQELSQHFLDYAKGLPLALKTLGRALYGRDQDAWKSALYNLNKIPDPDIFDSLKVSYYGLKEMGKKIFLHVACLHRGRDKEQVIEILDCTLDISSHIEIDILIEKSLLTIEKHHFGSNIVEMHDLIQEMAWRIVHEESPEPGKRSLLWHPSDISHVLMNNTGTGAIEAIVLCRPILEEVPWNCTEAFNEMHGLRLLHFDYVVFSSGPKFLPNSLRIIHWSQYPSKSLPSSFEAHLLSKLKMRNSKLVRLWDGAKDFPNLKYMDLSDSAKLASISDFTRIPNLKELNLFGCKKLREVHSSIAVHKKLKRLYLCGCESIKSLPSKLEMDSLKHFYLSGCSKVEKIPEFGEHMKNLKYILLCETAIEQIPSSIEHLVGLRYLNISDCKSLLGLPSAICNLKSLKTLFGKRCSKVDKLPGEMDCLEKLNLSGSAMREPLVAMKNLRTLSLSRSVASRDGIFGIRKNPDPERWGLVLSSLNRLGSVTRLHMRDCNIGEGAIPDDIGCLSSLEVLDLSGNKFVSLPSSIRCLYELRLLKLERCKRLEQLPDLPPNQCPSLSVNANNCTSLKRLSDPSKLSEGANVLSSLNGLGFLTWLDMSDCNIGEGAILDDIGCLSSLEYLNLSGNNFVSLPSSIRFLSKLQWLKLERCKRLEQLPDLPPNKYSSLFVNVDDCTSLKRLSDPSKLSEGANVLSCLNRLWSLTWLDMSDCNIGEGAILNGIGCLSSLKYLSLSGNNFISLPSSIRFLSKLQRLKLERCKRLEQLPDLPPKRSLLSVNVDDCTSLKRLSDPSKLSEGANVYDFLFSCRNCFRLVEEEGWINNRIFAMIMRFGKVGHFHDCIVWPGSEIPDWFNNQSVGDSIIVEPPLPPQTCDWLGIALCAVSEDSEHLKYLASHNICIRCSWEPYGDTFAVRRFWPQHLSVFYWPRKDRYLRDASSSHQLSFQDWPSGSIIKKCGARFVYKRDLEEFSRILKIPMPPVNGYDDEAFDPGSDRCEGAYDPGSDMDEGAYDSGSDSSDGI